MITTAITVLALFIGLILWVTVVIVPMREACVVEAFGKFKFVWQPGIHFRIPGYHKIAFRHETREQVIDIPPQSCITRDNIQVEVDGLVYLKVMDPERASYGIEDYRRAAVNLAQTTMRSEVGKLTLGETFSEREKLNEAIVREIDKASDPWGVKILRYELMNITPSSHVIHTLEQQMEAEREKRAEITKADAERQATINISEGKRQSEINISEGERQKRINEAEGRAQSIAIVATATAAGIDKVAAAIQKPGGNAAVKAQLVEQFIDTLGSIADRAEVSVVPMQLANVRGFFQGLSEMTDAIPSDGGGGGGQNPAPWGRGNA